MLSVVAALLVIIAPDRPSGSFGSDTIPGTAWTKRDWAIFERTIRWAGAHRIRELPIGTAIARLGATFVGATYRPGTLEVPGPERLVIDLRELDCVTFVENVLALVRFARHDGVALLTDPPTARARYESYLRDLRYRGGVIDGYPSRLHYFSDWLAEDEARGRIRLVTRELGAVPDSEPVTFMTTHRGAYRQLADSANFAAIERVEHALDGRLPRWYLPKGRIASAERRIEDGDLIAATSTTPGLDVAHTGFAIWRGGRLHLLHAPLVGKSVEISEKSLADRIAGIRTQDGIMVARARDDRLAAGRGRDSP
jgi:hypothetical protein